MTRRLLAVLVMVVFSAALVDGCSIETRYRIKTIVFTGVPPLHEEQPTEEPEQADPAAIARAEKLAREKEYRESRVPKFWQHGPFAAGECTRCHNLGQSKSFSGNQDTANQAQASMSGVSASSRLLMPRQQLCSTCHTEHGAAAIQELGLQHHVPAAEGECTGCHNPHQTLRRYMLQKADNRQLCGSCHDLETLSPAHEARPEQDCVECHNAHVGVTRHLLRADAEELTLLYGGGIDD